MKMDTEYDYGYDSQGQSTAGPASYRSNHTDEYDAGDTNTSQVQQPIMPQVYDPYPAALRLKSGSYSRPQ